MSRFIEPLESRTLFSATPLRAANSLAQPTRSAADTIVVTAAKLPNVRGTWRGTILVSGVHTQPIVATISAQTHTGRIGGTIVPNADSSIQVAMSGRVTADKKIRLTLTGSHSGGSINGTGVGRISHTGHTMLLHMTFVQNGQSFAGTLFLSNV